MKRPPFFYGWLMLPAAMLVSICTSPGQTFGIAVFNPYLRQALDLSSSQLSGAYMAGTMLASLPLTYVGALMDRYGPRRTLVGVVFLFGLTCVGVSQVSGLFTLFLAFFFLRFLGQGAMSMLARNALAMWFHRRLGLASGLSNLGMAAALGAIPALNIALIESFDWRGAYAILGVSVWFLLFPLLAFVFRDRPEDMGQVPDGGHRPQTGPTDRAGSGEHSFTLPQALRSRTYWIAVCCMASWSMSGTGVQFHIVSIFADRGLEAGAVAKMFSIYAVIIAACRVLGGLLADRFALHWLISAALACQGGGLIALNTVAAEWLLLVYPVFSALGSSLLMSAGETLWVRYFGRRHLGKIRGSVTTIGVAASGVGPFIMGMAYDILGGFTQVLWACAGLAGVLAVLALAAKPPAKIKTNTES
ncbi:MAG: MFS transporter [Candidatus Latescibacteria bacterium]|nr:MFS transporter [Candidatus Latescibacterota bacterium]